jgi:hypothetical protein
MTDPTSPFNPLGGPRLKPSIRPYTSQSPTRHRPADDLLKHLTPASAVTTLRSPTGPIQLALEGATPSEQAFAMRTATAARSIHEWLEELSEWPWPDSGGPEGFRRPATMAIMKVLGPAGYRQNGGSEFAGSLAASVVARYENRIGEILQDMDDLDVEDIKAQVLHNHIMPLSRPGTPLSDCSAARISYTRMDDLTAVVTAIVVQALPSLSRLTRLLNVWKARLAVLSLVGVLFQQLQAAEAALTGGWNALNLPSPVTPRAGMEDSDLPTTTTLAKGDYEYMKSIVERKVADPGRTLDRMLDALEGHQDRLPDEWLDRMEAIEAQFGEWAVSCETRIREADWARSVRERRAAEPKGEKEVVKDEVQAQAPAPIEMLTTENENGQAENSAPELPVSEDTPAAALSVDELAKEETGTRGLDGAADIPAPDGQPPRISPAQEEELSSIEEQPSADDEEQDKVELPPLPGKRDSHRSVLSQGSPSSFEAEQGRLVASPIGPQPLGDELDDGFSLTSSPPARRAKPRAASVTFSDSPDIAPTPPLFEVEEADTRPTTPLTESFVDDMDDSPTIHLYSPGKRRSEDAHLQQQLSEILNGLPAKFTLSAEPSPVRLATPDLNPPGLNLPSLKKSTKDLTKRSQSSMSSRMSSRASTPSFMLAPAYNKNPRPRPKTSQDIKVYHLSRSTGEAPIKLFIRCVGENGERVMVRVGGGWADLGEYLKEYVSHHGRRSKATDSDKVEIRDLPHISAANSRATTASPPSRPQSAMDFSPITPLNVRKTRKSFGASMVEGGGSNHVPATTGAPKTPTPITPANPPTAAATTGGGGGGGGGGGPNETTPSSGASTRSRSSSRLSWGEDDSPMLGLAGPTSKPVEMSEESRAWVESVKEKVRLASGERKPPFGAGPAGGPAGPATDPTRFGDMGKVGSTKRLFRKMQGPNKGT